MNKVQAVMGLQWGDEGKGKIVDIIGKNVDLAIRCQGGANAGHSVVRDGKVFHFHQLPSAIINEQTFCLIGNGTVIDPIALTEEINGLQNQGIDVEKRLMISDRAIVVLECHKNQDKKEEANAGNKMIGTTGKGIGPAYQSKAKRKALRFADLKNMSKFHEIMESLFLDCNLDGITISKQSNLISKAAKVLEPLIGDTVDCAHRFLELGKSILLESAQGTMLDVDHGTFPYVTSCNTTIGGCLAGSGLPPQSLSQVHGVVKAFTTRVGEGPFPTEIKHDEKELANILRGTGENQDDEFGTTTGRPRRIGWLDLYAVRRAVEINGVTNLHITKLDTLSRLSEIKICTGYTLYQKPLIGYPADAEELMTCSPVYETLKSWGDLSHCKTKDHLPPNARAYLSFISNYLGLIITSVGVGPDHDQTIFL